MCICVTASKNSIIIIVSYYNWLPLLKYVYLAQLYAKMKNNLPLDSRILNE